MGGLHTLCMDIRPRLENYQLPPFPLPRLARILTSVLLVLVIGLCVVNQGTDYPAGGVSLKGMWRQSPHVRSLQSAPIMKVYPLTVAAPKPLNAMSLARDKSIPYSFVFEGKALYHGVPCPNASVLVTVFTPKGDLAKGGTTEADGSYHIQIAVNANANDAMDWQMQAYTPDFKKVELVGRKIITEDSSVSIDNTLAFLPQEAAQ